MQVNGGFSLKEASGCLQQLISSNNNKVETGCSKSRITDIEATPVPQNAGVVLKSYQGTVPVPIAIGRGVFFPGCPFLVLFACPAGTSKKEQYN